MLVKNGGRKMPETTITHEFYGYKMVQNPSNRNLTIYVGAIDASVLRDIVSIDNAVRWDNAMNVWLDRGRNRTINEKHWKSIKDFLTSSNNERVLPSSIVISVHSSAFEFTPLTGHRSSGGVTPGMIKIKAKYTSLDDGRTEPVDERERIAWVLDGQHRIRAFRDWTIPQPYPMNVVIFQHWNGPDYEDAMHHQTYELNMGRPLDKDFKAVIREQYHSQVGHTEYKKEIAISWIRKDIERRGRVFSYSSIVGAPNIRKPFIIKMSTLENLIYYAYNHDSYLQENYHLDNITQTQVSAIGKYLFDFYEGVRLSIGLLNPGAKGTVGSTPEVAQAIDYWDIAQNTEFKQILLHNVGLKAVTKGLLHKVMREGDSFPESPEDVAQKLDHMRGIPWHDVQLICLKDDWVNAIAETLSNMYDGTGTSTRTGRYQLVIQKRDEKTNNFIGNAVTIPCAGWTIQ